MGNEETIIRNRDIAPDTSTYAGDEMAIRWHMAYELLREIAARDKATDERSGNSLRQYRKLTNILLDRQEQVCYTLDSYNKTKRPFRVLITRGKD